MHSIQEQWENIEEPFISHLSGKSELMNKDHPMEKSPLMHF